MFYVEVTIGLSSSWNRVDLREKGDSEETRVNGKFSLEGQKLSRP